MDMIDSPRTPPLLSRGCWFSRGVPRLSCWRPSLVVRFVSQYARWRGQEHDEDLRQHLHFIYRGWDSGNALRFQRGMPFSERCFKCFLVDPSSISHTWSFHFFLAIPSGGSGRRWCNHGLGWLSKVRNSIFITSDSVCSVSSGHFVVRPRISWLISPSKI